MRAQAVLNCGALRGAAKSYVLAVRIALSAVLAVATLHAVLIAGGGTDETIWITSPSGERSCHRGHKQEVRARCVDQIGAESRPCTPPRLRPRGGMAARRLMDM